MLIVLIPRVGPLPSIMDAKADPFELMLSYSRRASGFANAHRILASLDIEDPICEQLYRRGIINEFNAKKMISIVAEIERAQAEAIAENERHKLQRVTSLIEIPVLGFHVVLKMPDRYDPTTTAGKCLRELQRTERELVIGAGVQLFRLLQSRVRGNGIELNQDDDIEMSIQIAAENCLLICGTVWRDDQCDTWKLCEFQLGDKVPTA